MIIQPVDYFLVAWFALAFASTVYVAWDQYRNNLEPVVMKWGFILVTLYMGLTINGRAYPATESIAMRVGETLKVRFIGSNNGFIHPMHIHGHTMKILSCSRLARPVHHADTVLVMPNERVEAAFVADNPGNWMIHCHIIEHQDTGMMAWFRVA